MQNLTPGWVGTKNAGHAFLTTCHAVRGLARTSVFSPQFGFIPQILVHFYFFPGSAIAGWIRWPNCFSNRGFLLKVESFGLYRGGSRGRISQRLFTDRMKYTRL